MCMKAKQSIVDKYSVANGVKFYSYTTTYHYYQLPHIQLQLQVHEYLI